jgi:predicted CXXCH cytochrome family protein
MKSIAALLTLAATGAAIAGIVGTAHDLSGDFNGPDGNQVCIYCHTPHNATAHVPLWNRDTSVANYTMYDSFTEDYDHPSTVDGSSVLCMSCHDGTIALNAIHNGNVGGNPTFISGDGLLDTDLTNDHPISFVYQSSIDNGDTGLFPASNNAVAALLEGGKVQCASCHDVHGSSFDPFLRMSNAGSALCLTCHNK